MFIIDNNKAPKKDRIVYIDIARALAIFLVVCGHTTDGDTKSIIYSFHMPLFFIISGMLLKKNLPVLLFADILDEIFIFLLRKKEYFKLGITFAMVIFFTLGLTIPHISPYGWPLGPDIGFVAAGFMLLGMNIRHFFDKLMLSDILIVIGILAINILILFILRTLVSVPNVYMYDGNYGNIPAFLAYVFTHSTAVLIISVLIGMKGSPFNKYLVYMGMNTLGIFEIHKPIVRFISSHIVERGYSVENPIIILVIALIGIVVSLFINKIIITIIPELPGRND